MARLKGFGVDVVDVVGMEDARATAVENGLFTRGIGKAETSPTGVVVSIGLYQKTALLHTWVVSLARTQWQCFPASSLDSQHEYAGLYCS